MAKLTVSSFFILPALLLSFNFVQAQVPATEDSFFLAKKKGLLGRLGRSITVDEEVVTPVKTVDPYLVYKGRVIRRIEISSKGLGKKFYDTAEAKNTFGRRLANTFHKNSSERLIRKNLFFKEGDRLIPFLMSDNERYLRDQVFFQDAWIMPINTVDSKDSVDIVVITRDVFSIGGSARISSSSRGRIELREENLGGKGDKLSASVLYDKDRNPYFGYGGEFLKRNINGSLLNWTTGFKSFNSAFNSGRYEENKFYTMIDRPLVTRYSRWTGAIELSYNKTFNGYVGDSLYRSDFQYSYGRADLWGGYNFGARTKVGFDSENRLRHFVAARTLYHHFYRVPVIYKFEYNYNYADINGMLVSYSLYRQNFYRANFIYGFGRNEDVPEGLNASVIGGYTNKQGERRAYYGLESDWSHFNKNGSYNSYTARAGGFVNNKKLQDADILLGFNHFTRLKEAGRFWRNRNFVEISYARQLNPYLNQPLLLQSGFGLPYFRRSLIEADTRSSVKLESVFFNMKKFIGFRFAPFLFSDFTFIEALGEPFKKTNGYSALGGGIRTRNENLIFGTIEVKASFFPRVVDGMKNYRIDFNSNLKFKYNSSFIRKPEFITVN